MFLMFLAVILVPELFGKLRETPGKNSHHVWSKSERIGTSSDQKNKSYCVKGICDKTQNLFKINVWGGPGGFGGPGGGFSGSRSSGKLLLLLRLKKPPPGPPKPPPGPPTMSIITTTTIIPTSRVVAKQSTKKLLSK